MGLSTLWFHESACVFPAQMDFLPLDDLLIFSATFGEHLYHLKLVFQRLKQYGLKIKASKCQFFKQEISYLGRLVSAEGYTADQKNIIAVKSKINKQPKSVSELSTLLGHVGYFWRPIPKFSKIATPLYDLLKNLPEKSVKHPVVWNTHWTSCYTLY